MAVGQALDGGNQTYAIVGGAACALLGSKRITLDVDVAIPKNETKMARNLLRNATGFTVQPKTFHTFFGATEVELLAPPSLFRQKFDSSTPTVIIEGVKVLHPVHLLNAKCGAVVTRSTLAKTLSDSQDIQFLVDYCAKNGYTIWPDSAPNVTDVLVDRMVNDDWTTLEAWQSIGYAVSWNANTLAPFDSLLT